MNNNTRQISVWLRENFNVIILYKVFQFSFRGVSVWLDFSLWFSVSYSHSDGTYFGNLTNVSLVVTTSIIFADLNSFDRIFHSILFLFCYSYAVSFFQNCVRDLLCLKVLKWIVYQSIVSLRKCTHCTTIFRYCDMGSYLPVFELLYWDLKMPYM